MPEPSGALQARFLQALTLHQQGLLSAAGKLYEDILAEQPNHFDALHLLGVATLQAGRPEGGVALIEKAIALAPNVPAAYANLGIGLTALGRLDDAVACYDQAIALQPDYADAHKNRGTTLRELRRFEEALAGFERVVALMPQEAEAHNNLGTALGDLQRFDEGLGCYDRAIALRPDYAEAHYNRATTLTALQRHGEALASFDATIALAPGHAEAHNNRGVTLGELRRYEEALASYDRAIALRPDYAEAQCNKGHCLRLLGRFAVGWQLYEWRKKHPVPVGHRCYPQPAWLGEEDLAGKTLFVHWEQGLGDTLQFCRYARLVKRRAARVVLSVQAPLLRLLTQMEPDIEVIAEEQSPEAFDVHCPLMSLPLALETTLDTIPSAPRYLAADAQLSAAWSRRLPATGKPRIGVVWRGTPGHKNDRNRSMSLADFLPLLRDDADWICLQKEITAEDEALLRRDGRLAFVGDELGDFSDTAALIELTDLVITVDTSVAHLAGALGKPVWILLPWNPDWRWLTDRNDSPWYPSARLFRQQRIGNWEDVVHDVGIALNERIGAADPAKTSRTAAIPPRTFRVNLGGGVWIEMPIAPPPPAGR